MKTPQIKKDGCFIRLPGGARSLPRCITTVTPLDEHESLVDGSYYGPRVSVAYGGHSEIIPVDTFEKAKRMAARISRLVNEMRKGGA